MTEIKSRDQKS